MNNHNELKSNLKQYSQIFKEISNGQPIWKIGIYVRLSKDDSNSVSLSIVNQIKRIAKSLREFENFIIYDIYIDDGKTGTDFDRSDYMRLQKDVVNKSVNCIIVKDLTRYARNVADGIKELDEYVLKHKLRFISLGIPAIDTYKNPTAISSSEVYQALSNAEDHARITSKKVREIKELKREDGEKNGGFPPYGYLPNPNGEHWLYDPVAGEIKKQMYLWSLEGMSDGAIAKKLNSLGIPNPTNYKKQLGLNYYNPHADNNSGLWWPTTVRRILEDKTNIGYSVQGKSSSFDHKRHKQIPKKKEDYVIVPNCHEKTVTDEMFEKVNQIRAQRSRITKNTGKVHMFSNLVYCSNCKKAMKKTSAKGYEYLVCRTYKDAGKEFCTSKRSISFKRLEEIVLKVIQTQISLVNDLQLIISDINQSPIVNNQSDRINQLYSNTVQEIEKTEHLIDASYYDWKSGDISKEQYQRIRQEVENKLELLKTNLYELSAEQEKIAKGINENNEYFKTFLKYKNVNKLDRLMLLELIHRIYIHEDKSVEIEFNFKNQYLLIIDYIEQNRDKIEPQKTLKKKK